MEGSMVGEVINNRSMHQLLVSSLSQASPHVWRGPCAHFQANACGEVGRVASSRRLRNTFKCTHILSCAPTTSIVAFRPCCRSLHRGHPYIFSHQVLPGDMSDLFGGRIERSSLDRMRSDVVPQTECHSERTPREMKNRSSQACNNMPGHTK